MIFSQIILDWYAANKRELPWRSTREPYKIWLSEVILQQTRVVQGLPYYEKFVATYPTVQDMAAAPEEHILKLWQGLGYYSRARNMHATAKVISQEHNGHFPERYKDLLKLKGVGDYTASAIASICFNEPQPVVDGNVYRVLSRYFGVDHPIDSTTGVKYFKALARKVMDGENIRDYNQGIMEFGAVQCAPKKPYCLLCPLQDSCVALAENKIHQLPWKAKKTKIKTRYFNYILFLNENKDTLMEQRQGKGIWEGLYQFPLIETNREMPAAFIQESVEKKWDTIEINALVPINETPIIHKLSHQHLHTHFWMVKTGSRLEGAIPWDNVSQLPVPVLIADVIKRVKI
ncbi:MAG: A/G-specific adenine glycosylase [Bacteroidota bacterium]